METIGGGTPARDNDLQKEWQSLTDEAEARSSSDIRSAQGAPHQSFAEKHPQLHQEMAEHGVPFSPQEVLAQGYRFYRDENGNEQVLYPTPEYQQWLHKEPRNLEEQPHTSHHETWKEKIARENQEERLDPRNFRYKFGVTREEKAYRFEEKVGNFLRSHSEQIKNNLTGYYKEGQKEWLAAEVASRQDSQAELIADGVIAESLRSGYFQGAYKKYPNYPRIHDQVTREINKDLGNSVIKEEHVHALKYQALEEFIESGRNFRAGGWASRGRLTLDESGSPIRQTNREILEQENFVTSETEWQNLRAIARKVRAENSGLNYFYEADNGELKYSLDSSATPKLYSKLFEDKLTLADVLIGSNYIDCRLDKLYAESRLSYTDALIRTGDWQLCKQQTMDNTDTLWDVGNDAVNKFRNLISKAAEQCPTHQAEQIGQKFEEAKENAKWWPKLEPGTELKTLSDNFYRAVRRGVAEYDEGEFYFVSPSKLLEQNQVYFNELAEQVPPVNWDWYYRWEREAIDDYVSGKVSWLPQSVLDEKILRKKDTKLVAGEIDIPVDDLREALSNILSAARKPEVHENKALFENAKSVFREDLNLLPPKQLAKWLSDMKAKDFEEPIMQELLSESMRAFKESIRQNQISDSLDRIRRGTELYDKDLGESLSLFRHATEHLPNGTSDTRTQYLRQVSFEGLCRMLMAEGVRVNGQYKGADAREEAASNYFRTFGYAKHMDELNDFITNKVSELHQNSDEHEAKLFLRRYRAWARNARVKDYFEAYRAQADEQERRESAETALELAEQNGQLIKIFADTPVDDVKECIKKFLEEKEQKGSRFLRSNGHNRDREGGEDGDGETVIIPGKVALERINALGEWSEFIKENLPSADVEEAAMVFDPRYDSLQEALDHLDGNVYSAIAFNFAGKRCMIAECAGVNGITSAYGAMKVWCGDVNDREGWKRAFDMHTKTEASALNLCKSISHTNLTKEVMEREDDDLNHIVDAEDWTFKLAFHYFETGDDSILANNFNNRRRLTEMVGPHFWRPNPA